jgi:tRNA(Ile2) C34 agmatinyltransferase TiaS
MSSPKYANSKSKCQKCGGLHKIENYGFKCNFCGKMVHVEKKCWKNNLKSEIVATNFLDVLVDNKEVTLA